jgi:vitamin B12 transporter
MRCFRFNILLSLCASLWLFPVYGQTDTLNFTADTVKVSASRIPTSLIKAGKSIEVVHAREIDDMPVENLDDLLDMVSAVDVRSRSMNDIQGDISIRGGTFEQTLVAIDGIPLMDIQTGHHNGNLPISLQDIERIEVIKGAASRSFGANAFAGVVNYITHSYNRNRMRIGVNAGDFNLHGFSIFGQYSKGPASGFISGSFSESDGHLPARNTDFEISRLYSKNKIRLNEKTDIDVGLGVNVKDYGANNFYAPQVDQRETTDTKFAYSQVNYYGTHHHFRAKAYYRDHNDNYKVFVEEVAIPFSNNTLNLYNENISDNYTFGLDFSHFYQFSEGVFAWGVDGTTSELSSSNLGNHSRNKVGGFAEIRQTFFDKLHINAGVSAIKYEDWEGQLWPGAELSYNLEDIQLFAGADRSFRLPSFTELYYMDEYFQGNSQLEPESQWTYETGIRFYGDGYFGTVAVFHKAGSNLIDWVRQRIPAISAYDRTYSPRNVAENNVTGIDFTGVWLPEIGGKTFKITSFRLIYSYMDLSWDPGDAISLYVFTHYNQMLGANIRLDYFEDFSHSTTFRYVERANGDTYNVVNTRLRYAFDNIRVYLAVNNIFDFNYMEAGFVNMPGRWARVGLTYELNFD